MEGYCGFEGLRRTSAATRYNQWIYGKLRPYLGHRLMEIGCGIGNITSFLLSDSKFVLATDIFQDHLYYLEKRFNDQRGQLITLHFDISKDDPSEIRKYRVDTIVCSNVLEHMENDQRALGNMFEILSYSASGQSSRKLVLLVTAIRVLFGSVDRTVGHFRRYSKKEVKGKVHKAGFKVLYISYMNILGIFAWFIDNKILVKDNVPQEHLCLYSRISPILERLENAFRPPVGLSLICVGEVVRPSIALSGSFTRSNG